MDQVARYLAGLFELIARTYRLDPAALAWVRDQPYSIWLALGVALLAGVSIMIGHATVLLLNRITGWRFVAGLMLTSVGLVVLYMVESLILWALGSWWRGQDVSYVLVLAGVLVATAPQIWGFLVLIPYLGTAIGRLLSAWSAVCLWAVTVTVFGIGRWPAVLLVAAAWLAMHLISTACSPALSRVVASVFKRISGRTFWVSGADLLSGSPLLTGRGPE